MMMKESAILGMIAAFRWEVSALLRKAPGVERLGSERYRFSWRGRPVLLAIAGTGSENSYRTSREMLRESSLCGLVSIGFAGGLNGSISAGELILAEEVIEQVSGERFPCQETLTPIAAANRGKLLSVPAVVTSASEKRSLGSSWNALAVDMESAGVGRAAREAGLPFGAVKSITDGSEQSLAIDFQRCWSQHGELSSWKILREAVRSSGGLRDLMRLAGSSRRAAGSLALALASVE
jgi:adenosylhomocysteine nucleosidase